MTTDAVGGVWTYATELAAALPADVTLAVLGPPPSDVQRAAFDGDLRHHGGRLEWQEDPWDDVADAGRWLLELEAELRPDAVHLNGYAHGVLPFEAPTVVVGHSCVLSWWEAVRGGTAPWQRYRAEVTAGLHAADSVVAPTAAMLDSLRRLYGLRGGHVIHNGLRRRAAAAGPTKQPLVLGAGRLWDEAKGLDVLDAAAARIGWPVEVAGDGGDAAGVRLLGPLPHDALRAKVAAAAIFAHPARYEPFGLAPLEAAQSGCALVLSDLPSLRELWADAAIYVTPGDGDALAAALETLIEDAPARAEMAARARARSRRYSVGAMACRYMDLYAKLPVTA